MKTETLHVDIKHPIPFFEKAQYLESLMVCFVFPFLFPKSAYQIVVEELHPHRTKRETGAMECYQVPVTYQNAMSGGAPYYFAAELPQGIFRNLPHSQWAITEPIRAFGTPLWLHAKDTTSISKP